MDLNDTPQQAEFRSQVRAWLEEHKAEAPVLEGPGALTEEDEIVAARRVWQRQLAEGGLAGATWPKDVGGQGLGPIEQVIISQEIARAGVPGILDVIGVGMLGPTIIAHGTDEQKQRYLGPMLHGDEVWCQLFSEPAAGSDLAGIQTRAKQGSDGTWTLNGQKVWTTNAQFSAYGLLLARTDADVPKHKGLTMFIVPMDAEGVTVRGLRQITGDAEFNEVFFDDVQIPDENVVGGVGNGWGTALTTLMFERLTIGFGSEGMGYRPERFAGPHRRRPRRRARRRGAPADGPRRDRAARGALHRLPDALARCSRARSPGPRRACRRSRRSTPRSRRASSSPTSSAPRRCNEGVDNPFVYHTSFLPGLKSAGGTEEILRNTIGERVLGLPPEPRLDKGIPFSELRAKEKEQVAK